ncbi:peroxin-11B Pex11B-Penicillium chrysogenum [Penicillium hispanicum]|uniref:peroxin-11B Pex11B-Penicillium chrysogenum n=1 Tax=Penicillium hispanicum TaxID=1080232 RepID=UPI0025407EB7|nr:peroxin-11B Pex11B-Penicillium chrysogenum [Penicillium hispanicum]KAJ5569483.1 peroxin-11B Pex11B-Penicillium chrysogenum [Penicillium hispanicum]
MPDLFYAYASLPRGDRMLSQFNRFVSSGAGLEKTLRLIQSVAQIAAVFTAGSTAAQLTTAKLQLALSRRFFRYFGFIDSFQRVSALLGKGGMGTVAGWLELAKWTCFGLYFVLEDLTILHAMGVYAVPWEARVMREANQFWFYALSFSLLGSVYELLLAAPAETSKPKGQRKKNGPRSEKAVPASTSKSALVKRVVVDSCDLLIPAELLDWMPTGDLVVGATMVVSTLVTAGDIWDRSKKMDSRGIEPRTTPMLRGYYTTKPQAHLMRMWANLRHPNPNLSNRM